MLNCGYGRGFSVLDVIGSVKRASHSDFTVRLARGVPAIPRSSSLRPIGSARFSAGEPRLNDLNMIVGHALAWEKRLIKYRAAS